MLYAMSDIHGYMLPLKKALSRVDLYGDNRLVLLGDYIDYGPESGQVLRLIYDLQRRHGAGKVIVLRGNHEEMLLEWLDAYGSPRAEEPDGYGLLSWSDWLNTDPDFRTFRTLITDAQWASFQQVKYTLSEDALNLTAAKMVLESGRELVAWLRGLPYYYETERQIFVHAGIDEEAGEWWSLGTPEYVFTQKYPPTRGRFCKDIVAGHVGTANLAGDPEFHGVYFDGESHYYIDGTVAVSGKLPILAYDEATGRYRSL